MDSSRLIRPLLRLGAEAPGRLALPCARATAGSLYAPRGVFLDEERLIVCDSGNHRVLLWPELPRQSGQAAQVVLGQPDFQSEGPAAGGRGPRRGLHLPTGVLVVEGRLVVCDAWHHRLLVWNRVPEQSDTPPDYAIGQPNLESVEPNRGGPPDRNTLYWPYGAAWIAGRLYVADTGNRRVLAWDGFPQEDCPADLVLGQNDPHSREENRGGPPARDSFRWPHDLAGNDHWLFVADAGNHRVLGWSAHPSEDRPADVVLGQEDFTSAYEFPYGAQGPRRLRFPYAVALQGDMLAVADTANNRVLFWSLPPERPAGAKAAAVIGQEDFQANGENRWSAVEDDTLCWPYGLCWHGSVLAVADSGNNRVMLWDVSPLCSRETSHVLGRAG